MVNGAAKKPYKLIAVGRLAASTRDALGDTLGSLSGMALVPGTWRATKDGFAGEFAALPDRGFNVPEHGIFSDYQARVHRLGFELRGTSLSLTPLGTRLLRDESGAVTTGVDPGEGTINQFGTTLPSPRKGKGAGRISLDCEGLAMQADGRFFVSDEFGAHIYCCNADGQITDAIAPPKAFLPFGDGRLRFSSVGAEPDSGRAPNDGFEGLSLSPDGKHLFALLQSPLVQDRGGKPETRRFTRLLVFEVVTGRVAHRPIAHYVVELPLYAESAGAPAQVAEANEIVALGDKILVLTRESFGFGAKTKNEKKKICWKNVMAGDLRGATNLAGTRYERKAKSVAPKGKLDGEIEPVRLTPFLNIADEDEINRFGFSVDSKRKDKTLLSAKWESLVLSPATDPKQPRERLLFMGNDNDFQTSQGFMPDGKYRGAIEHDNIVLVYRVTLP